MNVPTLLDLNYMTKQALMSREYLFYLGLFILLVPYRVFKFLQHLLSVLILEPDEPLSELLSNFEGTLHVETSGGLFISSVDLEVGVGGSTIGRFLGLGCGSRVWRLGNCMVIMSLEKVKVFVVLIDELFKFARTILDWWHRIFLIIGRWSLMA